MGLDVKYKVDEGYINCEIKENEYEKAQYLIKSLYIYLVELEKQYPKNLKIKIMEVWNVIKVKLTIIRLKKRTRVY